MASKVCIEAELPLTNMGQGKHHFHVFGLPDECNVVGF